MIITINWENINVYENDKSMIKYEILEYNLYSNLIMP